MLVILLRESVFEVRLTVATLDSVIEGGNLRYALILGPLTRHILILKRALHANKLRGIRPHIVCQLELTPDLVN